MEQRPIKKRVVKKKKKYRLKYKVRWKVMIPFVLLIVLALYLIFSLFNYLFSSNRNQITICEYDKTQTLEVMNSHFQEVYEVSDYLYYGENLNFYTSDYDPSTTDPLIGKTIQLVNLCNQQATDIVIGNLADQQINVANIEPGYYAVYVIDGNEKQRLVYDEVLTENTFSTIARDKKVKTVQIYSNPEILNNDDAVLDKNYVFISVNEEKPKSDVIDVYIDPYGNNTDFKDTMDTGQVYHNTSENKEIFKAALQLKTELENAGLRVQISRDNSEDTTTLFGENGRLVKAYNAHAKYYIKLGMNGSPLDYARGTEIIYSAYSSNTLAKTVLDEIITNTSLKGSTMRYPDEANPGLIQSLPVEGGDGKLLYDDYLYVREAGGKATLAGLKDEKSKTNTFALQSPFGMQAIELDYIYLSSTDDLNYWKENRELIVSQTAKGLLKAWNIKIEE